MFRLGIVPKFFYTPALFRAEASSGKNGFGPRNPAKVKKKGFVPVLVNFGDP